MVSKGGRNHQRNIEATFPFILLRLFCLVPEHKVSKIIAITDSVLSPIAENASYVLTARNDMSTFVDSLVAPLSLINALIVALIMKKKKEVSKTYEELENIWDEYDVSEKSTDE